MQSICFSSRPVEGWFVNSLMQIRGSGKVDLVSPRGESFVILRLLQAVYVPV